MTKPIRQTVTFHAPSQLVYDALIDSKRHSAFTGAKANISKKVGGKISAYDGYIIGKNLELISGKKIVQAWHAADWTEDHESVVEFKLIKGKSGTKLIFTQKNVPPEDYEAIKQGWIDNYWQPMKEYFKYINTSRGSEKKK
jgi:activator of HSP90 ATPase